MFAFATNSFADEADKKIKPCPSDAILQMDSQFGYGTSDITTCLQKRTNVKNAIAWNSKQLNKSGVAQQARITKNLIMNYENTYDMKFKKDYKLLVVAYGAGGRWLLSDEAYNRTYNVNTGNPTRGLAEQLIAKGIPLLMCQNTIPGTKMVPSGVPALLDFQALGYRQITP
jgi:intracellular sulfur oxidation DsrE/DsrF family protein